MFAGSGTKTTRSLRSRKYRHSQPYLASKPIIWAEIFGGGFGGLIARHRPSLEPDPASMRCLIENWCRENGKPIERAVDYETRGSGPPLIADDADVAVIAAHTARLAVDTLIPRNPSIFPYSVYLIGLAQGWIFACRTAHAADHCDSLSGRHPSCAGELRM